ncbi:MAG: ANTAR domain-containing protein [Clostridia bacterium]|nr:ANTAR domain-containing protein [Clostridia bacterium]
MSLKEHVYSVLIVSASESFTDNVMRFLPEATYRPVKYAKSVSEAQRIIAERLYDLILINTPLPDDFGAKFSIDISDRSPSVVLLFVRNDNYHDVYDKVCDFGVFTIRKPLPQQNVSQALDFIKATRERLRKMEKKTVSLEEKMMEIKIVNRAKWTLINSLEFSEDDAHRYIEKQAMDRCVSKRQIAEEIIRSYDR